MKQLATRQEQGAESCSPSGPVAGRRARISAVAAWARAGVERRARGAGAAESCDRDQRVAGRRLSPPLRDTIAPRDPRRAPTCPSPQPPEFPGFPTGIFPVSPPGLESSRERIRRIPTFGLPHRNFPGSPLGLESSRGRIRRILTLVFVLPLRMISPSISSLDDPVIFRGL